MIITQLTGSVQRHTNFVEDITGESLLAVLNLLFAHLQTMSIQIGFLDLPAHYKAITVGLENKGCQ
jgi:hypothetical protein